MRTCEGKYDHRKKAFYKHNDLTEVSTSNVVTNNLRKVFNTLEICTAFFDVVTQEWDEHPD